MEYHLSVDDFQALDLFQYDHILSRTRSFRVRFYFSVVLISVIASILFGVLTGVVYPVVAGEINPAARHFSLQTGCWVGAVMLIVYLYSLLRGHFHRSIRNVNAKRFRRNRKLQLRLGLLNITGRYHVLISPEGLTETITSQEASASVQIQKAEISTACWTAVASIDRTDQYAFFTITNSTRGLSQHGMLVLPRSAFSSAADFQAFVDTACHFRDAAFGALVAPGKVPPPRDLRITSQGIDSGVEFTQDQTWF